MPRHVPLKDIAKVIRSKNAGPFELTLDIIFKSKEDFEAVRSTGVITRELIAALYEVPVGHVLTFVHYEAANAIKATIPRRRPQGSIGETDMHGAQQHVPLLEILIPFPGR